MKGGKLTLQQLADDYSVSVPTIRRAKADGVDVQDRDSFAAWVKTKAKRPHAWINGVPWEQGNDASKDLHQATAEEHDLMDEARKALNYDEARTLKTRVDAMHRIRQIKILENEYIHKDDVGDAFTRIGAAVHAALKQCEADLPAMVEGLAAAESKKKIGVYMQQIAGILSDAKNKFYQ